MSLTERRKGAGGELELCAILREHGWKDARRTHDGREQALRGDIAHGPAGVHLECKRTEKASVWAWWKQACDDAWVGGKESALEGIKYKTRQIPVVAFRRSRSPWLALIELDELLPLLALRERG